MTDKDTAEMLQRVIGEIETLRNQVSDLGPKADAYGAITQILGLLPRPSQGYGEDILWQLRKELTELQPKVAGDPAP